MNAAERLLLYLTAALAMVLTVLVASLIIGNDYRTTREVSAGELDQAIEWSVGALARAHDLVDRLVRLDHIREQRNAR